MSPVVAAFIWLEIIAIGFLVAVFVEGERKLRGKRDE